MILLLLEISLKTERGSPGDRKMRFYYKILGKYVKIKF